MIFRAVFLALSLSLAAPLMAGQPGEWTTTRMGSIFETGEPVELAYKCSAQTLNWKVLDFWQKEVESGTATLSTEGVAAIKPKLSGVGYYLLNVTPVKDGKAMPDSYASFAIVRPQAPPAENPFGVMTHFAQGMNPDMLPLFKKIGIGAIRDEHYWSDVERMKGVYEFSKKSLDYMSACKAAGIDPLVEMTFGNKLYGQAEGPSTADGYAGYANYGDAILKQFGNQVKWVEIWNEYNGSWFPKAAEKDRPKYYTEMLKTAYTKIKQSRPDVQVLGGAAVLIPLPYLEAVFKNDGLKYMDGVVVHPYRDKPEGVDGEIAELQEMIRKYNGGKDKPIWATETGRHTKDEYDWEKGRGMFEKGRDEGARYLARQYTLLLKQNVEKIFWYLASDHANFISMGLLRHHQNEASGMPRLSVTPVYVSYANLIHQLGGATFVKREAIRDYSRAHVYLFKRGDEEIRVCWATQPAKIRVKSAAPLTMANLMGGESIAKGGDFDLSEDAIYLRGKADDVSELDTGSRVIASTKDDYSKAQGGNGWFYGYYDGSGTFTELKQVETMWGYKWGGAGGFLSISAGGMHPERFANKETPAVMRWKSPVAGRLRLKGSWTCEGKGDGIQGGITVDGKEISREQVGGGGKTEVPVEAVIEVKVGSLVDFACHPNASTAFDATGCDFLIFQEKRRRNFFAAKRK